MEYKEFELMLRDEQFHWWYKARRRVVNNYLNRYIQGKTQTMILDIASACGANFSIYKEYGKIYGVDISEKSISFCRSKGINRIVRGDVHKLAFASGTFDIVLALDALEHFKDDLKVMREILRVIKIGGILIVTTPAMNILWSQHDRAFHHLRRYSSKELSDKLRSLGFVVEFINYRLFSVFLPVLIFRKIRDLFQLKKTKFTPKSDFHTVLPLMLSTILDSIDKLEGYLINKKYRFPVGVSIFCVAKKRMQ